MADADPQFDRKLAGIFRQEAAEHVQNMTACLVELDSADPAVDPRGMARVLFRETHSLKGAARAVGRTDLEAVCHVLEGLFQSLEQGKLQWSSSLLDLLHQAARQIDLAAAVVGKPDPAALIGLLRRLEGEQGSDKSRPGRPRGLTGEQLETQEPPRVAATSSLLPAAAPAATADSVRISVDRLSTLLYQVEDLVSVKLAADRQSSEMKAVAGEFALLSAQVRLAPASREAQAAAARALSDHQARLEALKSATNRGSRSLSASVDSLLRAVKATLMLPLWSLASLMSATVRELSRSQGKDVELKLEGGDLEMDRRLLDELREVLIHLLRNAVDHGIESPQGRASAGKPPQGVLVLSVAQKNSGTVVISLSDDGAGVDLAALARAGQRLGMLGGQEPAPGELLPLIFSQGLSTAPMLTPISGRGVGLSIVRDKIEALGGAISVESKAGQGTRFVITLPMSLATFRAVEVHAGGQSLLVPIAHVARCARLDPVALRVQGALQTITFNDETLPLVSLARVLELETEEPQAAPGPLTYLVLESGGRRMAFSVARVVGEQEVVSKPVEPRLTRVNAVSGAAIVDSGKTLVILNVASLIRSAAALAQSGTRLSVELPAANVVRSILLAEDSITSRTLLKNILELAGYQVTVAVDGVQALEKLGAGSFDLVVSDIEMPGLDGFGLTCAIRDEPQLAHLPVILVTSLSSPADREKGAEAGANAYIVKSSFDEGDLLQAIRELV